MAAIFGIALPGCAGVRHMACPQFAGEHNLGACAPNIWLGGCSCFPQENLMQGAGEKRKHGQPKQKPQTRHMFADKPLPG